MDALRRREKIIQEKAFEQKKRIPRLKFNPGLALVGFEQLGPGMQFMATLTVGSLRAVTAVIYPQLVMSANQRQDSCPEPQQSQ